MLANVAGEKIGTKFFSTTVTGTLTAALALPRESVATTLRANTWSRVLRLVVIFATEMTPEFKSIAKVPSALPAEKEKVNVSGLLAT